MGVHLMTATITGLDGRLQCTCETVRERCGNSYGSPMVILCVYSWLEVDEARVGAERSKVARTLGANDLDWAPRRLCPVTPFTYRGYCWSRECRLDYTALYHCSDVISKGP